jgi:integrase/recombinase XerD
MNNNISITLSLDKRRQKLNGKFPLRICVFERYPRKQKYFPTKYEFSEIEYSKILSPIEGRKKEDKLIIELQDELSVVKQKAVDVAKKIIPFNFDSFEKKLYAKKSQDSDVFYQYDLCIQKKTEDGDIKTASNYECSKNAFIKFQEYKNINKPDLLDFRSVNLQFLEDFERYYMEVKKGSISTVGSYTRTLRAIFNIALENSIITENYYPFGKGKYVIPSSSKVKKALSKEQLQILYDAPPLTIQQEIAKDFWFFSYMCYGMNVKDICLLRYENIDNHLLQFSRAKTNRTKRTNIRPIVIHLTSEAKSTLKKYSVNSSVKKDFVFGKISENMTKEQKRSAIDAFNRFISQHIKKLAASVGLDSDISAIWARHTFATMLIRTRGSKVEAQECLGHASMKITEGYYSGFAPETLVDISSSIMNFKSTK